MVKRGAPGAQYTVLATVDVEFTEQPTCAWGILGPAHARPSPRQEASPSPSRPRQGWGRGAADAGADPGAPATGHCRRAQCRRLHGVATRAGPEALEREATRTGERESTRPTTVAADRAGAADRDAEPAAEESGGRDAVSVGVRGAARRGGVRAEVTFPGTAFRYLSIDDHTGKRLAFWALPSLSSR